MVENSFGSPSFYNQVGKTVINYFMYFGWSLGAGGGWTMRDKYGEMVYLLVVKRL